MKEVKMFQSDDGRIFENKSHAQARDDIISAEKEAQRAFTEYQRLESIYKTMVHKCEHPSMEARSIGDVHVNCTICDETYMFDRLSLVKKRFPSSTIKVIK